MDLSPNPILDQHPIFHSRCVEEVHAFAEGAGYRFEFRRREASELDMRVNGVYLPRTYVGYIQYGAAVTVVAPMDRERAGFWLQLPLRGSFEVTNRGGSIACGHRRGAVSGPAGHVNRSHAGSARINFVIARGALEGQLASLLGDAPNEALELLPEIDFGSGYGRSLARYLSTAVLDLEQTGSMLRHPTTTNMFEQFMMAGLLLSHPHNYGEKLRRLERDIAPRDVRRAIDYIEAHLDTSITIADIVEAAGVAGRTLFSHFRRFKGVSPLRYVHNARFQQVRQAMLRADSEESVTDIAMRWGFTHMGRFSVEYRKRFGESPFQTLKRRRTHR